MMRKTGTKTPRQLERHLKGVANHRRIAILMTVAKNRGITVEGLSNNLRCNFKTVSEHTRRLVLAGLIHKRYVGRRVAHTLSPYGKILHEFIKIFQHS